VTKQVIGVRCVFHDMPSAPLLVALTAIAIALGTVEVCSGQAATQRSDVGTLKGQVGTTKSDGAMVPPESATVYVLFSSAMAAGSFSHVNDVDTAAGQFSLRLNDLLSKNKELKKLEESARRNPRPEAADQIATYYLQTLDEALTQVRSWLTKHPDRSWQMKTVTPDERGFWLIEGLQPGGYEVVARGKCSGYDADWESKADLAPGRTISMPLTRPRFFRTRMANNPANPD
jgi:hypothetical protein